MSVWKTKGRTREILQTTFFLFVVLFVFLVTRDEVKRLQCLLNYGTYIVSFLV